MRRFKITIERYWEGVIEAEDADAVFITALEERDTTGEIVKHTIEEVEEVTDD